MTIDEIEKKCAFLIESESRDLRDIAECRRMEALNTLTGAARIATENAATLARFILAVLPTIRATEYWNEYGEGQSHCEEEGCTCANQKLRDAISKMREEMGK